MNSRYQDPQQFSHRLNELGDYFVRDDIGAGASCLSKSRLVEMARNSEASLFDHRHLQDCVRCASLYVTFRGLSYVEALPLEADVAIRCPDVCESLSLPAQILGKVSLESLKFAISDDDCQWHANPMWMRVNIVLDPAIDQFAISVLDVPEAIVEVHVTTPHGRIKLIPGQPDGTFELFGPISLYGSNHQPIPPVESLIKHLADGKLQLHMSISKQRQQGAVLEKITSIHTLLEITGAIEREYDYVLPTGLHTDTHINAARLCHAESSIEKVAEALDAAFPEEFDIIVTNGWPLAMIARRMARIRNRRNGANVREIMHEGYVDPMPVEDIPAGSRALVLVDVTVTGRQLAHLTQSVQRFGSHVVGKGAIVAAVDRLAIHDPELRALCHLRMRLSKTANTQSLKWRETRYFNPLSNCMTIKRNTGRSPTEFYNSDVEVKEFWNMLEQLFQESDDIGRFYRRHKVIGKTHYCEFIDTLELLRHDRVGRLLVERVRDKLAENQFLPHVILCTDRLRGKTFACALLAAFELSRKEKPLVVTATKSNSGWLVDHNAGKQMRGRCVLIVDAAVGHGKTVDQLSLLAIECGARSVAIAVILSRLSENCEIALNERLDGGFYRLYNLPIRPVVIHGVTKELCPVCQRQAAIESAATETRSEAIRNLAAASSRVPFKQLSDDAKRDVRIERQLCLFESSSRTFLSSCHAAVARGVTLHSLYAAKNNGMAPLALPELVDKDVPSKNKRAMVKDLPRGALEWSGEALESGLEECLASDDTSSGVWSASAFVLATERRRNWLRNLGDLIERSPDMRDKPQVTFWNTVECGTYLVARDDPQYSDEIASQLRSLADRYVGTAAAVGLKRVLETLSQVKVVDVE